ncbi:HemK2/MTQ2 family protein methyltransferase [Streptomyces silvensis]|uniref:Methyltransferase n=1 Tax=Streptomyces silvensis TaxID=1765722 RepID=A0A0W7X0R5_9ACTN|nr:HemK2/MTQ2 family protein methyltransferase [Streptomyces silvensis]KUF16367.1 methyltransferase [Streptomyces silvensis]
MTTVDAPRRRFGKVLRIPGVYAPQADTNLLAEAMRRENVAGMDVLDLCSGSGVLAAHASRLGAHASAVDISRRAVLTIRLNALLARQRVAVHRGDLLAALPGRTFDLIVSNPPYVPAPPAVLPSRGPARAWDAGPDGRVLLDRICETAPRALRPGGTLLLVHSAVSGPEASVRRLREAGLRCGVSDRAYVPLGPVMRERLTWLRERGLLGPGDDKEELVIIRAEKR